MFNVGDKVRCISNSYESVDKGDILEVSCIDLNCGIMYFKEKHDFCYSANDFELVKEEEVKNDCQIQISTSDVKMNLDEVAKIMSERMKKISYNSKSLNRNVNHPNHYNQGCIEVIDYIEDKKFNFNLGNAVKYISRCNYKGRKKEDLEKAIWYLEREISMVESGVNNENN